MGKAHHETMSDADSSGVKGTVIETDFFREIEEAVCGQKATFCCGGEVPISANSETRFDTVIANEASVSSPPVVLRWDRPSGKTVKKLILPITQRNKGSAALEDLIKDCAPATFGKDGAEVLDNSYRKATKLDSGQFSTSFNPHDVGIIDIIAQALLPGIAEPFADGSSTFADNLGVIAELYKLNERFEYDWSNEDADVISWAAFYSDCEHEVQEVESGHRITLTYNLYVRLHISMRAIMNDLSIDDDMDSDGDPDPDCDLVSTELHGIKLNDRGGYEDGCREEEYGNEPSLVWRYSSAAILAKIPQYSSQLRRKLARASTS
ncbi:hypothetical protein P7C71_g2267, partial [Lecanoromycetidae sp. Uapishka_2]